jgi:hypothetical protein
MDRPDQVGRVVASRRLRRRRPGRSRVACGRAPARLLGTGWWKQQAASAAQVANLRDGWFAEADATLRSSETSLRSTSCKEKETTDHG